MTPVVAIVLSSIALWQNYQLNKKQKKDSLSDKLNHLLELAIQYPELESKVFIEKWVEQKDKNDISYMRYDIYCNLLFNFLAELFDFYKGDKDDIESFCDVKTWIRMHRLNWQHPMDPNENIDGYSPNFRAFINSYLQ